MLVLITYDVNTETPAGRKRLRKVAKRCVDHGQRVQNSVFECLLDAAQYAVLKAELTSLIDPALDSLRFYQLGNNYKSKVEHRSLRIPRRSLQRTENHTAAQGQRIEYKDNRNRQDSSGEPSDSPFPAKFRYRGPPLRSDCHYGPCRKPYPRS